MDPSPPAPLAPDPPTPPAPPTTSAPVRAWTPIRPVFLAFWLLYATFAWPGPPFDDLASRALALGEAYARGSLVIGPPELDLARDVVRADDGSGWVPEFGPATGALAAPLCWAVHALLAPAPPEPLTGPRRDLVRFVEGSLLLVLLTALSAASVAFLVRTLELVGCPQALAAACLYGLGLAFPVATTITHHALSSFGLSAALLLLVPAAPHARAAALAGLAVGVGVLSDLVFTAPAAIPVGVWVLVRGPAPARLGLCAGATLPALLFACSNTLYHGAPWLAQHPTNLGYLTDAKMFDLWNVYYLLLTDRGILAAAPVLALAVFGVRPLWSQRRDLALLVLAVVTVATLQHIGRGWGFFGGHSKGPRYLLPATLLLTFPLAHGLARWPRAGVALGGLTALVSWVQAQTPFFATLTTAALDVVTFGPRLRLVHSIGHHVTPGVDVSTQAFVLSPLLAAPALVTVILLLAPTPRWRRRLGAAVAAAWLGAALIAGTRGAPRETRATLRIAEMRRLQTDERWPEKVRIYGDDYLALGRPDLAADAFLQALRLAGWDTPEGLLAREGLGRAVRALVERGDTDAARQALTRASELRPVGAPR